MNKTVVTVTGIRPDFIRMSEIFKVLDQNFDHVLVHTGQHYDKLLSDVFFKELEIRKPDFNLNVGGAGKEHFHQTGELSTELIELFRSFPSRPDLIIFLGDSNSVVSAVALKKEGYKIAHIEAGMRSGDKRMLEEINRTVCDHCSDYHFVYHETYKKNLIKENLPKENIFVVGNTIVEVCRQSSIEGVKSHNHILLDIHRPENFNYQGRLKSILDYANECANQYGVPVKMLKFGRTMSRIEGALDMGKIQPVELMSYKEFLTAQYDSLFIISDSGTAQEEPALLRTPVIVPRDYTERPQSVSAGCSFMIDVNTVNESWENSHEWLSSGPEMNCGWLGEGLTSQKINNHLKEILI